MFRWLPYTFVRTTAFFIGGILTAIYFTDWLPEKWIVTVMIVLVICYMVLSVINRRLQQPIVNTGWIAFMAVFFMGYIHLLWQTDSREASNLIHQNSPIESYEVVITSYVQEKEQSWKTEGRVTRIKSGNWKNVDGKIVLYFSKKDFPQAFHYGDVLLVRGGPSILQPPANPGEFDYKRFLTFRNIYHQHFLRGNDVQLVDHDPPMWVMSMAIRARERSDRTLKKFVSGPREQAIASALVLGVTDGLDNELLNAYAATGAMHVLAVSGLHISIIYLILSWLLKPLNKTQSGKLTLACVSLLVLWAYAFITGLSPSVLRAVTMFSFVAVARPWSMNTNIYNTLAASAFCLLLYDPYLIMSVGFQLSYLAVLGIVYLQPRLYPLYEADTRVGDEVWKITCVSIAAQLSTFSLGLLYFHQFPNYFLLSNLLVIPISFGVLVLGLLVLALGFIPVIAAGLGFLLTWTIKIMNLIVFAVESIPFSLVENIYISTFQCWLLMIAIIAILALIQYRRPVYFGVACVMIVWYGSLQWIHFTEDVTRAKLTVYKVPGYSAVDLMCNGKVYCLADSALMTDREKMRFHIRPNRLVSGVNSIRDVNDFAVSVPGGKLLYWKGKTVVYVVDKDYTIPQSLVIDLLIIGRNSIDNLREIPASGNIKKIVIDSSNNFYRAVKLMKQADVYKLDIHSVWHEGAFNWSFE